MARVTKAVLEAEIVILRARVKEYQDDFDQEFSKRSKAESEMKAAQEAAETLKESNNVLTKRGRDLRKAVEMWVYVNHPMLELHSSAQHDVYGNYIGDKLEYTRTDIDPAEAFLLYLHKIAKNF